MGVTNEQKLMRDIKTLNETIRVDWRDMTKVHLTRKGRPALREHIVHCIGELQELIKRLDATDVEGVTSARE